MRDLSPETLAMIIVAIPTIFSVLLVYAEKTKKRWAWYCLFPVIIAADIWILITVCRGWILVLSRGFLFAPAFPYIQFIFVTILLPAMFGGFTLLLWRQKPKWNR
jgi:hypothetical protein